MSVQALQHNKKEPPRPHTVQHKPYFTSWLLQRKTLTEKHLITHSLKLIRKLHAVAENALPRCGGGRQRENCLEIDNSLYMSLSDTSAQVYESDRQKLVTNLTESNSIDRGFIFCQLVATQAFNI